MMLQTLLGYISLSAYFASLSLILPLIIGSIRLKELKPQKLLPIFVYVCIYAIFEIIAWYYVLNAWQNHFIGNTVIYLDLFFISYYYYNLLNNSRLKIAVVILFFISLVLIIWSHLFTEKDYNRLNSIALSIENLTITTFSLFFFYQLLNSLNITNLFTFPHFWIAVAILIYFCVIFFVDIFAEFITFNNNKAFAHSYWDIKDYLTFFHRIFLAIGLWFSITPTQSSLSSK